MNDSFNDPHKSGEDLSESPARGPIDPQGVTGPPPPPPPAAYPPAWGAPQQPKRGLFQSIGKLFTALSICAAIFFAGYYVALFTFFRSGGAVATSVYHAGESETKIAIIPVTGMIVPDSADFVHDAVQTALDDPHVKAVVLRVDSGGGLVGPSEQIYHELTRLSDANKPIIASFGGVAASGGYYISCAAEYIFAQPACVTGSIGVIAQAMTFEKLLTDNGIQPLVITAQTSQDKDVANTFLRTWTSADKDKLRKTLDAMHDRFKAVVKQSRGEKMGEALFAATTTGDAYTTDEALEHKLIDEMGYLEEAIIKAGQAAGIASSVKPTVVMYGPRRGFLDSIMGVRESRKPSLGLDMNADTLMKTMIELGTPRAMFWYQP